jgi:hypothetical protein
MTMSIRKIRAEATVTHRDLIAEIWKIGLDKSVYNLRENYYE